jgi:nitrite reductase (NADH) large subunit
VFGNSHLGDVGHKGNSLAAGMPDSAEVCGCNGVCKGTIVKAIKEQGLFTLEDVRKHTKASSSCGSCTGLVEQILASTIGGAYQPADSNNKAVCGCTEHSHGEVRRPSGTTSCCRWPRPRSSWPGRRPTAAPRPPGPQLLLHLHLAPRGHRRPQAASSTSAHANIQKDGTYSVVPHVGRPDHPDELRAIADAAEKYKVPTVKVTGGQRIDLLA